MKNQKTFALVGLISALTLFIMSVGIVAADSQYTGTVGYIVLNSLDASGEQKYISEIQSMGFTVQIIDDSLIASTNFSNFKFIVVGEGSLANSNRIPVNFVPTLILNTKLLSTFNWSTTVVQTSPNPYMVGRVNNQTHFITYGFPQDFTEYNQTMIGDVALSPITRATKLKIIVSHPSSTNDGVVATAEVGTVLKNGMVSKAKGVYYGINKPQYWTAFSEQIFKNSIVWLVTDFNAPVISGLSATDITSNSAVISWSTDKTSNYTISYGVNGQLTTTFSDSSYTLTRSVPLTGLDEKTAYSYMVKVCNQNGYCTTSSELSFTTKDITNPTILSNSVSNITNTSAKISVSSDELSRYYIYIGTSPVTISKTAEDTLAKLSTEITLTNLNENTLYYYVVQACDLSLNCVNSSASSFNTLDFTAPNMPTNIEMSVLNPGNKILISWQTPSGEVPSSYRIYISSTPGIDSFNLTSPSSIVSGNEFTDDSAAASQQKYYIIRAADASGNEEKNTKVFAKYDIQLQNGYNFISFPINLLHSDIASAMHSSASYKPVSEIITFDTAASGLKSAKFDGNSWDNSQISTISNMQGLILKSDSVTKFTFVGYPNTSNQVIIKKGMNLVGITATNSKAVSAAISQNVMNFKVVEVGKRETDGRFTLATYYPENDQWTGDFTVEPGKAYWLKANQDFVLGVE